ncbi:hypothetical protein BJ991_003325 [Microbacterium immunditiarum]|uniref:Uncharacterized protein n=1 Tax=Microbacterium immunditiarum TaxID=337480 RepID=A0A7Y9GRR5_9MICO|nr:hypothetical protein [Microbacterium immunditiarum]
MNLLPTILSAVRFPVGRARGIGDYTGVPVPPIVIAAAILLLGIGLSASTTADPLWWHLHFSRLGMFDDVSGYTFNATLTAVGGVIALGAQPLRTQLRLAVELGVVSRPNATTILPAAVAGLGISMSAAGMIPLSVSEFLHERGANGMLISFAVVLGSSRWLLKGVAVRIRRIADASAAILAGGVVAMVVGIINLAALEAIMFTLVLVSIYSLSRSLDGCLLRHVTGSSVDSEVADAAPQQERVEPRRAFVELRPDRSGDAGRVAASCVARRSSLALAEMPVWTPRRRRRARVLTVCARAPSAPPRPAAGPGPATSRSLARPRTRRTDPGRRPR